MFQSQEQPFAHTTSRQFATKELPVHTVMSREIAQLCANTGYGGFARREMTASFFTNMTCPKCLNVFSSQNLVGYHNLFNRANAVFSEPKNLCYQIIKLIFNPEIGKTDNAFKILQVSEWQMSENLKSLQFTLF